ncbi:hypothetical protein [Herminiimonas arsenitoxidans]|uniref:hypothetical protein n=1 Tax=Herminiimonas arsenitoxidans TaxID=1809410 RepID=UPI001E476CDD|nr:hypothetical protein [Herminiimonas arsenitoxidans]
MDDLPCAGMDVEKPVHCAEQQSGVELALEHLATAPSLTPTIVSFIMPASLPVVAAILASAWTDAPLELGVDPPYLRTQRLRI